MATKLDALAEKLKNFNLKISAFRSRIHGTYKEARGKQDVKEIESVRNKIKQL